MFPLLVNEGKNQKLFLYLFSLTVPLFLLWLDSEITSVEQWCKPVESVGICQKVEITLYLS